MVEATIERAIELRQVLLDYVYEADGAVAAALEAYSAEQLARSPQQDIHQRNLVVYRFTTEVPVAGKLPFEWLMSAQQDTLSEADRQLLRGWERSFIGLFTVTRLLPEALELMNWLTAKHYTVHPDREFPALEVGRLKLGDVVLARISPVGNAWIFAGANLPLGNLGKPKLAVAIGSFKQHYRSSLYSDAPELLEAAWQSVERYHQDFVEFFGGDRVTLPGYQLGKKIAELQEIMTQKRLAAAGIDQSQSLAEAAAAAGVAADDLEDIADTLGVDRATVDTMLQSRESVGKMVTPKIELPPELKSAPAVTVLAHPRWGQMFLPTYTQMQQRLSEVEPSPSDPTAIDPQTLALVQKYLDDPAINAYVWQQLAAEQPQPLQAVLRSLLDRPHFDLATDLGALLQQHRKPLAPELPEIASVPAHLHDLFQAALAEVNKSKAKAKVKAKTGFQR